MRASGAPDDKESERVRDPDSIDMGSDIVDHFDWCARIERSTASPFAIDRFPTSRLSRRAAAQGRVLHVVEKP